MNTFDKDRAILLDEPQPDSYSITAYIPLRLMLEQGKIHPQEHCLIAIHEDIILVLPTLALVYHHVVQGTLNNLDWMITFCCLCNAGAFYNAEHKGTVLKFAAQGYYDVMSLIADEKTQSYWNHLTGECLTGDYAGDTLVRWNTLTQMTAQVAHQAYPNALFTDIELDDDGTSEKWNSYYRLPDEPDYGGLLKTLGEEDIRLPRHDMGLGIWTQQTQRYYSALQIYDAHSVIVDQLDGRTIVVCIDEMISLPTVFYCETKNAVLENGQIQLDNDQVYKQGVLYQEDKPIKAERPNHNAIRWYSFSSLFPKCEIYPEN